MVKELGTFFEQFVKEYLHVEKEAELVKVDYHFKITEEDYKEVEGKRRQAYWSDIDVFGLKGDTIFLVSCSEWIATDEQVNKILKHFSFAERAINRRFLNKQVCKVVACVSKHRDRILESVEVWYLKDMFIQLREKIRKREETKQHVEFPFEWLIRDLDAVGTFSTREEASKHYKFPYRTHITSHHE